MRPYDSLIRHSGNANLFAATEMSIVSALAGRPLHLHAEGLRGTGKTTILRAARDILPRIERIKGCAYNCRPERPHCPLHRGLSPDEVAWLGTELVPMPFLEISHSAKIGTVVGSIDLAALTDRDRPAAALLPGTLPRAHRGIVFVDEINRLADTCPDLADVLLDVMGTKPGRIQIEEAGLPVVELPVEVTVWAASNPDEDPGPLADIRRQLADRFDVTVAMARPSRADVVVRILGLAADVAEAADQGTDGFRASEPGAPDALARAAARLGRVRWPAGVRAVLADLYIDFGLESLRAVEAMQQAAALRCALAGRDEVGLADLIAVAELALRHRVDLAALARITSHLRSLEVRAAPDAPLDRAAADAVGGAAPTGPERSLAPERAAGAAGGADNGTAAAHMAAGSAPGLSSGLAGRAQTVTSAGAPQTPHAVGTPQRTAAAAPQPLTPERGGIGRLLARFLGGGAPPGCSGRDPGGPYPSAGALGGQGERGAEPGDQGRDGPVRPVGEVAAPPRRARSIFELVPEDVVTLPEEVRRT